MNWTTDKKRRQVLRSFEGQEFLSGDPAEAPSRLREVIAGLDGFSDVRVAEGGWVTAKRGMSHASWGELLTCRISPADGGVTVSVKSESRIRLTLLDWGANKRNVEQILRRIDAMNDGTEHL